MKTAIIFHKYPESLQYFVIEGDLLKFHLVMIGSDDDLSDELCAIMYTGEGVLKHKNVNITDFQKAIVDGAQLIECGEYL